MAVYDFTVHLPEFAAFFLTFGLPRFFGGEGVLVATAEGSGSPTNSQREQAREFKELWNEHHPEQRKLW